MSAILLARTGAHTQRWRTRLKHFGRTRSTLQREYPDSTLADATSFEVQDSRTSGTRVGRCSASRRPGDRATEWNRELLQRIDLRWHDLRRESVRRLLAAGVDIHIIQLWSKKSTSASFAMVSRSTSTSSSRTTRGTTVCASGLSLPLPAVDAAVLEQLRTFLGPDVLRDAIETAMVRLRTDDRASQRAEVMTELAALSERQRRLVELVGATGDVQAVAEALKANEGRRQQLEVRGVN